MLVSRQARTLVEYRAGGVSLDHLSLTLSSAILSDKLAIPSDVRLGDTPEGEPAILWRVPPPHDPDDRDDRWGVGGNGPQAFWRFLDLADAERPEAFVAFARRFGVLGLWSYRTVEGHKVGGLEHWVPSIVDGVMTPRRYLQFNSHEEHVRIRSSGLMDMMYEPVSEWRRWAGWFRAAVMIGYELRRGRPGSRADWTSLGWAFAYNPDQFRQALEFSSSAEFQAGFFARLVQTTFVRWSGLVPAFEWNNGVPRVSLVRGGKTAVVLQQRGMHHDWPENSLYPALVCQLLGVLTAGNHVAACSRCGRIHPRSQKARTDQPAYCPPCVDLATRERKAKYAARRRSRASSS